MNNRKIDNSIDTPVQYLLKILGGKWKLPILCILMKKEYV
jgi:DNA-binding HxlR family transcriptional regulator